MESVRYERHKESEKDQRKEMTRDSIYDIGGEEVQGTQVELEKKEWG